MLKVLLQNATQRAKYFCAGLLGHYSLNIPVYAHFIPSVTIPGKVSKFTVDRDAIAKVPQQCNIKHDSAKLAQEQSAHLLLCLLIADPIRRYGTVIRRVKVACVLDAAFDVCSTLRRGLMSIRCRSRTTSGLLCLPADQYNNLQSLCFTIMA